MITNKISATAYSNTKPHFQILNGLRGVAAVMVIFYHIFEAFATSPSDQHFNHGYLAVDFFFMLSGFVVAYAYDDRWSQMSVKSFFKRRIIRLHPMIVAGTLLGVFTFVLQGGVKWNGASVGGWEIVLATVLTAFLIPVFPGSAGEVRGNGEMYPLNGPVWSLFFEYIGNVLYALFLRRLSTKRLAGFVAFVGLGLVLFLFFNLSGYWHLGVGWSLGEYNFLGGSLRLLFSFSAGLLLSRLFKPQAFKSTFGITALIIVVLLSIPYVGANNFPWLNSLYEAVCVILVFPLIVYLGASGRLSGRVSTNISRFLGDISYPLYIVHYPFMYLFYAWVWKNEYSFVQVWPLAIVLLVGNIALAYLVLQLFDIPVRRFLTKRFMSK